MGARTTYGHINIADDIGVVFVDSRLSRTNIGDTPKDGKLADDPEVSSAPTDDNDRDKSYLKRGFLGMKQWAWLEGLLGPGGALSTQKALIVVSPVPVVFLSTVLEPLATVSQALLSGSQALGKYIDVFNDYAEILGENNKMVMGMWELHKEEQDRFLSLLHSWKAHDSSRGLIICSGDVHFGAVSNIYVSGQYAFPQITSSAIANGHTWTASTLEYFEYGSNIFNTIGSSITYTHDKLLLDNNYGRIKVSEGFAGEGPGFDYALYVTDGNGSSQLAFQEKCASQRQHEPLLSMAIVAIVVLFSNTKQNGLC
jgi:phosphodiesterase/alkaline phosphatase D-like protein